MDRRFTVYNKLNCVLPYFERSKYPYNYWTPEKINETKKIINMVWAKDKRFLITIQKSKRKSGGMESKIYVL